MYIRAAPGTEMGATVWHYEIAAGRFYKLTEREQPITEHLLYDARQSKETNARAFLRYLALLRGMHTDRYVNIFLEFDYEGDACLVCSYTSTVMHNIFHRKSSRMFVLGSTPLRNSKGIFVEVDCEYSLRKVMMCGKCHDKWTTDMLGEPSLDSTQAETILRRFWKQDSFPSVRSFVREEV